MTPTHHVGADGAMLAAEWVPQPGAAVPLVFLHAGVTDGRMWNAQMAWAASRSRSALRYDRRGFGATTIVAPTRFSHVADLWRVLDAVGLARAVLVGCSQGGRIAIDAALEAPARAHALVLAAPAVSGARGEAPTTPALMELERAIEAADRTNDVDALNRLEARLWLDGPDSREGRVGGTARELFLAMNGIALRSPSPGEAIEPPPAWDRLGEIRCPLLLVRGDLDEPVAALFGDHIVSAVRGARGVVMPGTAHLPPLEAPDAFNALLAQFVS